MTPWRSRRSSLYCPDWLRTRACEEGGVGGECGCVEGNVAVSEPCLGWCSAAVCVC